MVLSFLFGHSNDCQPPKYLDPFPMAGKWNHFSWVQYPHGQLDRQGFLLGWRGWSLGGERRFVFSANSVGQLCPKFYLLSDFTIFCVCILAILPIIWRHLVVTKDNLTNSVFTIPGQFPSILYTCHSSNNFDASYPGLPLNQRPHFPESVDAKLVMLFQFVGLLLQPSGLSVSRCFLWRCSDITKKKL